MGANCSRRGRPAAPAGAPAAAPAVAPAVAPVAAIGGLPPFPWHRYPELSDLEAEERVEFLLRLLARALRELRQSRVPLEIRAAEAGVDVADLIDGVILHLRLARRGLNESLDATIEALSTGWGYQSD